MAAVTTSNGNKLEADDDSPDDRLLTPSHAEKPGFFTVYKKGQGYYTRLGTALLAMVLIVVLGLFVYQSVGSFTNTPGKAVRAAVTAVVVLIGSVVAWRIMNAPKSADFLISTDSEMKKVSWPSRQELFGSTRVVILFLFVIALMLFVIDVAAGAFFQLIGLLKFGLLS